MKGHSDPQLNDIIRRLSDLPEDHGTAEASIENCGLWVAYWRRRATIAALAEDNRAILTCNKELREWEQRKSAAEKMRVSDRLEQCLSKMEEMNQAADVLASIATVAENATAEVATPCKHIASALEMLTSEQIGVCSTKDQGPVSFFCERCEADYHGSV